MYYIGAHVSVSGGVFNAPLRARELDASGFAMFVKNQRQWVAKPYTAEEIEEFKLNMASCGFTAGQVLPHAGYLINLANPDDEAHAKSMASLMDEIQRCEQLGLTMLNLHPGSHLRKITVAEGCDRVASSINTALSQSSGVKIVIENTAGTGGNLGSNFEEIKAIIDGVDDKSRVGVCIDTMHSFGAGYDIRTRDGFLSVMDHFDGVVGMDYLSGMHLNDSMVELNARRDRHESLGKGFLGIEVFKVIMQDERFKNIPLALETPNEAIWKQEIALLREFSRS
ncbi:MAG: deoxyribonuclease IV [Kiritimatiellae bacterium]|nr:deoxyribonuclease IV [Kiritimatiellia bacterium]